MIINFHGSGVKTVILISIVDDIDALINIKAYIYLAKNILIFIQNHFLKDNLM